jgi:molybdate transport system ATP-binding protein
MEGALIHIDIKKTMLSSEGMMTLEINTDINLGTLTTLFGSSGSGKTTLLRILAGLTKPDSGIIKFMDTVWFDSKNKINIPAQKRRISLMFQDYALFPNMTVEQNIIFAQEQKNISFVHNLIEILQLSEFSKQKINFLSGGQKQRVALARAVARKPHLLLLDEPLSALDSGMRILLQDEIAKVHKIFNSTTLMVSHDLTEVFRLSQHVVCLKNGKVSAKGNPQKVFSNSSISGKFQVTGQIAAIENQDTFNIVTIIVANSSIIKVICFDDDLKNLSTGDNVFVFSKAFSPIIKKLQSA